MCSCVGILASISHLRQHLSRQTLDIGLEIAHDVELGNHSFGILDLLVLLTLNTIFPNCSRAGTFTL